jgi:hypothetical protein
MALSSASPIIPDKFRRTPFMVILLAIPCAIRGQQTAVKIQIRDPRRLLKSRRVKNHYKNQRRAQ